MASYWMAQRLTTGWRTFFWAGAWPAVPATADDSQYSIDRLLKIQWLQLSLSVPVAACLWNFSNEIITIWAGARDPLASFALKALILAAIFDFAPASFVSYLFARKQVFAVARVMLGAALLKVILASLACYFGDVRMLVMTTAAGTLFFAILMHVQISLSLPGMPKNSLLLFLSVVIASAGSILLTRLLESPASLRALMWHAMLFLVFAYALIVLMLRFFFPDLYRSLEISARSKLASIGLKRGSRMRKAMGGMRYRLAMISTVCYNVGSREKKCVQRYRMAPRKNRFAAEQSVRNRGSITEQF
jgi:hypothetical protein